MRREWGSERIVWRSEAAEEEIKEKQMNLERERERRWKERREQRCQERCTECKNHVLCDREHGWGHICQHLCARPPFDEMCTCACTSVCVWVCVLETHGGFDQSWSHCVKRDALTNHSRRDDSANSWGRSSRTCTTQAARVHVGKHGPGF